MCSPRVGFVGTYPPTACGIATFTASLRDAILSDRSGAAGAVIRVLTAGPDGADPPEVAASWDTSSPCALGQAVEAASDFDCIVLQHEFGIYGANDGEQVAHFVETCPAPVVTVLHTVVPTPTPRQHDIIQRLLEASAVTVVQTHAALDRLRALHAIDDAVLAVIPHGAELNLESGPTISARRRARVLTWGLVGPGKGIEFGIGAMALLSRCSARPHYVVAGRTHPNVLAKEGENYREGLQTLAQNLGVADRVHFDASYRDFSALRKLVRSADVILLPYLSRDQATSGVLVEALASGKPVIATAFPHAVEALAGGAGIVVPHEDPAAIAEALREVLLSRRRYHEMQRAAVEQAALVAWPTVGLAYRALVASAVGVGAAA